MANQHHIDMLRRDFDNFVYSYDNQIDLLLEQTECFKSEIDTLKDVVQELKAEIQALKMNL